MCGGQRRTFWELVLSCFVFEAEALLLSAAELCTPGSLTSKLPDDSQSLALHMGSKDQILSLGLYVSLDATFAELP